MKRLVTLVIGVVFLSAGIQYADAATKSNKVVRHSKASTAKVLKKALLAPAKSKVSTITTSPSLQPAVALETSGLDSHPLLLQAPLQIESPTSAVHIESETAHVDSETVEIESETVKVESETVELESETVHVESSTAFGNELSHPNDSQHSENHGAHTQIIAATRESSQDKD
jgi:hypothetical protein